MAFCCITSPIKERINNNFKRDTKKWYLMAQYTRALYPLEFQIINPIEQDWDWWCDEVKKQIGTEQVTKFNKYFRHSLKKEEIFQEILKYWCKEDAERILVDEYNKWETKNNIQTNQHISVSNSCLQQKELAFDCSVDNSCLHKIEYDGCTPQDIDSCVVKKFDCKDYD